MTETSETQTDTRPQGAEADTPQRRRSNILIGILAIIGAIGAGVGCWKFVAGTWGRFAAWWAGVDNGLLVIAISVLLHAWWTARGRRQ